MKMSKIAVIVLTTIIAASAANAANSGYTWDSKVGDFGNALTSLAQNPGTQNNIDNVQAKWAALNQDQQAEYFNQYPQYRNLFNSQAAIPAAPPAPVTPAASAPVSTYAGYPGTAHRTDYDEFQDVEIQGTAGLANLAIDDLNKTNDQVIQNITDIGHNAADIKTNAGGIAANATKIDNNTTAIGANTAKIGENTAKIDGNTAAINATQGDVKTLQERAHIASNSLSANHVEIMHNKAGIAQNAADITDVQKVNAEQDKQITNLNGFTGEINAEVHKQAIANIKRDGAIQDNAAAIKNEATIRSNQVVRLDQVKADKTDVAAETAAREAGDQTLAGDIKANKSGIETNAANIAANQASQSQIDAQQNTYLNGTMSDVGSLQQRTADNENAINTVSGNVDNLKVMTASGINANATTIGQVKAVTQGMQKQDYINNSARIVSMKAAANDSHTQALIAQQTQATDQTAAATQKLAADDHTAIQQETTTRTQQFNTLAAGVNHAEATGAYAHARIDAANRHIAENRAALEAENAQIAQNSADIAANRQQLGQFEQSTNSKFSNMDKKIDENRKHASRGIAGANALAGLPQLNQDDTFGLAAAAGGYDGESAVAVGASAHPFANKAVTVKAGVTASQGGNMGWNVGAGLSW